MATPRKKGLKKKPAKKPQDKRPGSRLLRETGEGCFTERYLGGIALNLNLEHAALFANCDPATVRQWDALAEQDRQDGRESIFTAFVLQVREQRAKTAANALGTVHRARRAGDWHAARYLLALQGYQPADKLELEHTGQVTYVMDEQDLGAE